MYNILYVHYIYIHVKKQENCTLINADENKLW